MKKIFISSIILLLVSFYPMYQYILEFVIEGKINSRYEVHHAYVDEFGFENIIDIQKIVIDDKQIEIIEENTGVKAPLTSWDVDENVPAGDIVKLHLLLNGKEITNADEIWLSNRNRGGRYFSWLDILIVHDRQTREKNINIVQRLTDDHVSMEDRRWKVITITENGDIKEEKLTYNERSDNHLGVKLVNFSFTGLMEMGYYSDITKGYPSYFFPLVYPFLTSFFGIVLSIIAVTRMYKKGKHIN